MDNYQLQKLRDLPIEGVAERLGLQVTRHKSLCPFHDDHHASLSYSVRRNTYRCFVCGAAGNTISLVMQYLRLPFPDACRWLADEHNVIVDIRQPATETADGQHNHFDPTRYGRYFEHPWLNDEARHFLYQERWLDPRVVGWCRLTSWRDRQGVSWLQIPYYARDGQLVGLQNRNLVKGALPRFRFPPGAVCTVYNMPVVNRLRRGEPLYITEGCSDCWAMLSAGHKAIAIPSATLLSAKDKELLTSLANEYDTPFHMYPDRDEPGERLYMQLRQVLPNLEHHQLPPDCKDFADYYTKVKATETTSENTSRKT